MSGPEDRAVAACLATVSALQQAGVPSEALAEYVAPGRRLGIFPKPATMRHLGHVWRLGVLLLDTDGALYGLGRATRAAERGRPGYQSVSREQRRDLAAAALRGGHPEGTAVNFDAVPLPLSATGLAGLPEGAPIGLSEDEVRVRWRAGAPLSGAQSLEHYLRERAELLINPPFGAD